MQKTQVTQICVTGPQCDNTIYVHPVSYHHGYCICLSDAVVPYVIDLFSKLVNAYLEVVVNYNFIPFCKHCVITEMNF
jgi:hypothetical protein